MKKLCLLLPAVLLFVTPAFAQMEAGMSMMTVGASVGYGMPIGDFSDSYDGGFAVGLNGCYMFTDMYGLELAVDWTKFSANDEIVSAMELLTGEDVEIGWTMIPVTLDFMAAFPAGNMKPYLKGGVGMYFESMKIEIGSESASESENKFGINFGAGIKIPFGETTMFDIGGTFHHVMTEDEDVPGSWNAQYFTIKAGIGMTF